MGNLRQVGKVEWEIYGKSERLNGKYEKDLQESRAQLIKANQEAEKTLEA